MPTAAPDQLAGLLQQLLEKSQTGPGGFGPLSDVLDKANAVADQVTELPDALLQELKQAVDPPDWFSLLVYLLLRLSELDPHLSVGALDPGAGWARAVTVTYRNGADAATLGLAVTDSGTHGVIARLQAANPVQFGSGRAKVTIEGTGSGEWLIPFGGPATGPTATASLTATLTFDPGIKLAEATGVSLAIGPLRAAATLSSSVPIWHVELGLGTDGSPGLDASLKPGDALGVFAQFLSIAPIGETYSPKLVLADRTAPLLSLGSG